MPSPAPPVPSWQPPPDCCPWSTLAMLLFAGEGGAALSLFAAVRAGFVNIGGG